MSTVDPITDYTQTQRIVLLIDLTPTLHLQNPNPYLKTILSLSKTLLNFPPLSSSLFSFKPFFSSLSPILSTSKLPSCSRSLSFNDAVSTLDSLSTSLATSVSKGSGTECLNSLPPRGSYVAASMRQLIHEYAWDLNSIGSGEFLSLNSNLVVLFSPICRDVKWVSDFMEVEVDDLCLSDVDVFRMKFSRVFKSVKDAFVKRDIHFSWIDVNCALMNDDDQNKLELGLFECGIKGLGWGYSLSDSILLGSALIPFGLIYPRIGVLSNCSDVDESLKRVSVPLSLEILDVNGKPLECKICDLQLVDANMLSPRQYNSDVLITSGFVNPGIKGREHKKLFWDRFGDGISKFHVNAVWKREEFNKFKGELSHPVIVCELLESLNKDKKESFGEFYADKVLDILAKDIGELDKRKPVPVWPILLSYLYRKGYWALVTLSNDGSDSCKGILKPFTVSSALFSVIEDKFYSQFALLNVCARPTPLCKGKKNDKTGLHLFKDLTWNAFCKAAFEHSEIPLEEIYYAAGHNKAKKLKFLKCWIKQIEKSGCGNLTLSNRSNSLQNISNEVDNTPCEHPRESTEVDNRVPESLQESEQPIPSSASVAEDCQSGASRIQDTAAICFRSETLENFFDDLPAKIQQGLQTEGVDLKALAERLVNSSLYWLYQKQNGMENNSQNQTPVGSSNDACDGVIANELTKGLLSEPKGLVALHKKSDPSSKASGLGHRHSASEDIVKEYELQILFRMEILQSEAGAAIEEATKQKLVKQICFLLEAIQCHLEVGFFGDWSLKSYVEKIIKSRYCQTLGDVVDRIYTKMDLLLFSDEEDDPPSHLLNSEDSNQSWNEHEKRYEKRGKSKTDKLITVNKGTSQVKETIGESPHGSKTKEGARKLIKAQESRDRARRFSSFTSWMPDLQRVWAPKPPKAIKQMSGFLRKPSKRKDSIRSSCDRVCETPMTGHKRSCSRSSDGEDDHHYYGSQSGGSASKALFQDDD